MVEEVQVTFRPAVAIGIGGMGTFVVHQIKQLVEAELDRQVRLELISEADRQRAMDTRFQFIGIDSNREEWQGDLTLLRIGETQGVRAALQAYVRQEAFTRWWPREWVNPGEFHNGCGHVRLKGRLAYFLAQAKGQDVGEKVSRAVEDAVQTAPQARLRGQEPTPVPVFVCASLSGGTGGGTFLSVLQAIRQCDLNILLYGVVIDSSIASLGAAGPAMARKEIANNWAGLIELDAWMNATSDLTDAAGWRPFWPFEQSTATIEGIQPVADLIWLFHYANRKYAAAGDQRSAINQVTDSIATWIHSSSSAAQWAMDADLRQWVADHGNMANLQIGRSIQYGSMGIAHLRFPSERVLDFLGATLALEAVENPLLQPDPGGREVLRAKVDSFLQDQELREFQWDDVLNRFRALKESPEHGIPKPPPVEAMLLAANKAGYRGAVENALQSLEGEGGRFTRYRDACQAEVATILDGRPRGEVLGVKAALAARVRELLVSSPHGLSTAAEFLRTLRSQISDHEARSLERELSGEAQKKGLLDRRLELRSAMPKQVQGIHSILPGGTKTNIQRFAASWWRQYLDTNEGIIERNTAQRLYEALADEIDMLLEALGGTREAVHRAEEDLRRIESTALPASFGAREGGQTYEVLTEENDVRRAFVAPKTAVEQIATDFLANDSEGAVRGYESILARLRDVRAGTRGAADLHDATRAEVQRGISTLLHRLAEGFFQEDVRTCTVWRALERQLTARKGTADVDDKLAHIASELETVVAAAQPMFPLEDGRLHARMDTRHLQSPTIMLVANQRAQDQYGRELGDQTWLTSLLTRRVLPDATVKSVDTPDHQRVTISMQLIGFPLMGLLGSHAAAAEDAFADVSLGTRIWSDMRAAKLPTEFEPIVRAHIDYVVALALGWGILTYGSRADGAVDRRNFYWPHKFQKQTYATGIKEVFEKLELSALEREDLREEVNDVFDATARKAWLQKVGEAAAFVSEEVQSEHDKGADRYQILQRMRKVTNERKAKVARAYNPEDPETDSALDELRPQ